MLRLAPRAGCFWPELPARAGDYPNSSRRLINYPRGRASPSGSALCRGSGTALLCGAAQHKDPGVFFLPAAGSPPSGPLFQAARAWQALPGFFSVLQLPLGCAVPAAPPDPGPGLSREFLSLVAVSLCGRHGDIVSRAPPAPLGLALTTWQRLQDGAGEGRPFPPLHGIPPDPPWAPCPACYGMCQARSRWDLGCARRDLAAGENFPAWSLFCPPRQGLSVRPDGFLGAGAPPTFPPKLPVFHGGSEIPA